MVKIIQEGNKTLRKKAALVPVGDIKSAQIKKILADMKKALDSQHDGVALAAPQIGVSLRIFIISRKAFEIDERESAKGTPTEEHKAQKDMVFINPEITKLSKKRKWTPEGCLSVRWFYGEVQRAEKATVTAYNEKGEKFTRGGSGLIAQIFQHETDHLEGVLFIDKARNLEEIDPEELQQHAQEHDERP